MASIYDKALKRKDFSGVTNKEEEQASSKAQMKPEDEKDKAAKADDPKAGADVGKIVNLIASDCNRVSSLICFSGVLNSKFSFQISLTASALYYLYGGMYRLVSSN